MKHLWTYEMKQVLEKKQREKLIFVLQQVLLKTESFKEVTCAFRSLEQKTNGQGNEDTSWKVAFNAKYPVNFLTISRSKREIRKSLEI